MLINLITIACNTSDIIYYILKIKVTIKQVLNLENYNLLIKNLT